MSAGGLNRIQCDCGRKCEHDANGKALYTDSNVAICERCWRMDKRRGNEHERKAKRTDGLTHSGCAWTVWGGVAIMGRAR
jgi:hypothetical protein